MTSGLPTCKIRSLAPFPKIRILLAVRSTSDGFREHSSDMRIPVRITVDSFITQLHRQYKTKTIKRKIASLKAFFHHMEYREQLAENPFARLDIRFRTIFMQRRSGGWS